MGTQPAPAINTGYRQRYLAHLVFTKLIRNLVSNRENVMNKYYELDKQVSKKIMSEFKGITIPSKCPDCKGDGCDYCDNGEVLIEY